MSSRIDKTWLVFVSIENVERDRCVDLFERPDRTCGFEEFRRDVEDRGVWTPTKYFSGKILLSRKASLEAAVASVPWLAREIRRYPSAVALLR
jgi:energy-converting hydrogenase Eha subunit B